MAKLNDLSQMLSVIFINRDPTEKDVEFKSVLWISVEYCPNRVWIGGEGKWKFFGKLLRDEG